MRRLLDGMIQCHAFRTRHSSGYLRCIPRCCSTFSTSAHSRNVEDELPKSQVSVGPSSQLNGLDTPASSTETTEIVGEKDSVPASKPRQLPLSPLMDPDFHAARTKYQAPKPFPSGPPSEFSKRLANNLFAQALATPVRQCAVNYTSLPSFFLQDFELMSHPITGKPYHMPRSLAPKHKLPSAQLAKNKNQSSETSLPLRTPTLGSRYFVALRQALFQSFHKRKSGHHKAYERFGRGGQTTKERLANLDNAIWRADMDTFILSQMRENIGSALLYVARRNKGYTVSCVDWQDAASKEQIGAVLWLGKNLQTEKRKAAAEVEEEQEVPPGEFDILNVKGNAMDGKKIVPVFNLRGMLDKKWVERLRDRNLPFDTFGAKIVVIKKKNATKDILLDLWRLQGYIATYGEEVVQERKPGKIVKPKITADTKFRSILD